MLRALIEKATVIASCLSALVNLSSPQIIVLRDSEDADAPQQEHRLDHAVFCRIVTISPIDLTNAVAVQYNAY